MLSRMVSLGTFQNGTFQSVPLRATTAGWTAWSYFHPRLGPNITHPTFWGFNRNNGVFFAIRHSQNGDLVGTLGI